MTFAVWCVVCVALSAVRGDEEGITFHVDRLKLSSDIEFGIMMDAGSTGTRLHIYTWPQRAYGDLPDVHVPIGNETWTRRVQPGLSSYVGHPEEASKSLHELIDFAKTALPEELWKGTPLYLKATAGMRMIPEADQEAIMNNVREYLITSGFDFKSAQVMTGSTEGAFGWVTVNFLKERLLNAGNPQGPTIGALDLGGASTQITFEAATLPAAGFYRITVGNNKQYTPYTHSYNGLGNDQAWYSVVRALADASHVATVPCLPTGYTATEDIDGVQYTLHGGGSGDECVKIVNGTLFPPNVPCELEPCTINGTYQPHLHGEFMGFSGFIHPIEFFNLTSNTSLTEMLASGSSFLQLTWEQIQQRWPNNQFLPKQAWSVTYAGMLLATYGFSMESPGILFEDVIPNRHGQNLSVGWTLGAMIYEAALFDNPNQGPPPSGNKGVPIALGVVGGMALIVIIGGVIWYRRRKPSVEEERVSLHP